MFEAITIFGYALVLGLFHAFEADHIAAVTALSSDSKKPSHLGLYWGIGHTTILLIVGILVLLLDYVIPTGVSTSFEGIAGLLLMILGISVISKVRKSKLHIHTHSHEDEEHTHVHSHKQSKLHKHEHKSFIFGVFHGLAGSGALLLIIIPTTASFFHGLIFILIFGLGSIFAMMFMSFLLGFFLEKLSKFISVIQSTAGGLSVAIGFVLILKNLSL